MPDFFETLGAKMVLGRSITEDDTHDESLTAAWHRTSNNLQDMLLCSDAAALLAGLPGPH